MKKKISITVEECIVELIKNLVKTGKYRNKSHLIEYSLLKFMEKEND